MLFITTFCVRPLLRTLLFNMSRPYEHQVVQVTDAFLRLISNLRRCQSFEYFCICQQQFTLWFIVICNTCSYLVYTLISYLAKYFVCTSNFLLPKYLDQTFCPNMKILIFTVFTLLLQLSKYLVYFRFLA